MTLLENRLNLVAAAAVVAVVTLAACQDRNSPVAPAPASTGEYSIPAGDSATSSSPAGNVPGKGSDVTTQGSETGVVGGASGTVGSGGKPGSGSAGGAGTGAAVSSDSKADTRK